MVLTAGTRLGPYEILAPLGAGGFGEVYKARDTRLDRIVAIKVLSSTLSSAPEFRERFDREARTISQLDHPYICALFDVGEQHGVVFLVMQYLEGETLADRLKSGGLPLDEALRYAIQIADALDKAHRAGIVHRDLKPANIMLTQGCAKLLDFGLAKTASSIVGPGSPTQAALTTEGMILGTLHYMAPEQLAGQATDNRADLFAFGAVIYEMVTGRKAFDGPSQASVIAAVLDREPPPMTSLQPVTPATVNHLVTRCLAKKPDERWQTACDVMHELKWMSSAAPNAAGGIVNASRTAHGLKVMLYSAGVATLLLSLAVGYLLLRSPSGGEAASERFPVRVSIAPPEHSQFSSVQLALSPDGTTVAYPVRTGNKRMIWLYSLRTGDAHVVEGTDDAYFPFWSSDSADLGFLTGRGLVRIAATGGIPQVITSLQHPYSGAWGDHGLVLFAGREQPGIFRIHATGGPATRVTTINASREEMVHLHPRLLPGGRRFLYFVRTRKPEYTGVYVRSLDADDARLLVQTLTNGEYCPPGYLLFVRDSVLMAQRFNLAQSQLEGDPVPVLQSVNMNTDNGVSGFSVSSGGSLAYYSRDPDSELKWIDHTSRATTLGSRALYRGVELSPDDRAVLVQIRGADAAAASDVWTIDTTRDVPSRVTVDARTRGARWSPDGAYVFFDSHRPPDSGVYRKRADGSGVDELVWRTEGALADVSRNGHLLITENERTCIVVEPLHEKKVIRFLDSPYLSSCGRFSPDGHFVAYTVTDSGRAEVYIAPFPAGAPRIPISKDGGYQPRWRKDGHELFFLSSDGAFMSVTLAYEPDARPSPPRELFRTGTVTTGVFAESSEYTVSADGQRFLMIDTVDRSESLTVITHWSDTLKR